jgi:uncharacterized UPF0160 family protein
MTVVATHDGGFHADEVFALAVLRAALGSVQVVRTRDPEKQAAAELRIDVGGRFDPVTGDFDHHQRGGAGERDNGIPYASFGLVWREFAERIEGVDAAAAETVDRQLVQGVDANDVGIRLTSANSEGGPTPLSVSQAVVAFNPPWDVDSDAAASDAAFDAAVEFASVVLKNEIASATGLAHADRLVQDAIAKAEDPRIVLLPRGMPWHRPMLEHSPDALYAVYPKSKGNYAVQAVPEKLGEFDNRKDFPAEWAGLEGEELVEVSGVPDAIFAHNGRFYASAKSLEGALALARAAVEAD